MTARTNAVTIMTSNSAHMEENASGTTTPGVTTPMEGFSPSITTPVDGVVSPTPGRQKGRVRFNSTASDRPPRETLSTAEKDAQNSQRTLSPVRRPRPSLMRGSSYNSVLDADRLEPTAALTPAAVSALAAHQRAQEMAATMGSHSAPASRRTSFNSDATTPVDASRDLLIGPSEGSSDPEKSAEEKRHFRNSQAYDLVRLHAPNHRHAEMLPLIHVSGTETPDHSDQDAGSVTPGNPREGILAHLLKLYKVPENSHQSQGRSGYNTPLSSGTATPTRRKWYNQDKNGSMDTLATLAKASAVRNPLASFFHTDIGELTLDLQILASPGEKDGIPSSASGRPPAARPPMHKRSTSANKFMNMLGNKNRMADEARITIHVANILKRQEYIIKLCRSLMMFGAPTHRLEEYLRMTARVLETDGQFLYLPGCMIISFDDRTTHTTEVKIVRSMQGVDLGRLKDIHEIYKEVLHDVVPLDDAIERLDEINKGNPKFPAWVRVIAYGFASAFVGPFAFQARPIDMPIAFFLGSFLGFLQLVVAPRSPSYSNVFEISAALLTSFLARAFGSIRGGTLFCFSALSQSSIALILPGYLVLCAALELQSKAIVPGSIRMVYAIIYSLFLGFGITIGVTLYGAIDVNAVSQTTCQNTLNPHWNFLFVPLFAFCLTIVNQAKWKQMPVMLIIALAGYVVNFFSGLKFQAAPQISNMLGALAVGLLANLYSRIRHGVAAALMLPAIFVQVPSGLAATGSILSGLSTANQITNNVNGTAISGTTTVPVTTPADLQTIVFNVAANMIQIAVGITVGLFFAALVIWPLGKRRSGLFTF